MNNNNSIVQSIKKELNIDDFGNVTCTIRGTSRLADVNERGLRKHFSGADFSASVLAKILLEYGFEVRTFSTNGIPSGAVSLILDYYANDAGKRCTKQAKQVCRAFMSIGFATWVKHELNWQPPNQKYIGYILKEPRQWTKMFGDDFYDELSRLTGLSWDKKTHQKPCVFAQHTYDLVYFHLPNEVYESIKQSQKEHGGYIHRMHEFLSPKGLDALKSHLVLTMNILTASSSLSQAKQLVSQSLTRNYQLDLFKEDDFKEKE